MRKTYGKDGIRYLHCQWCGAEFSEWKGSALWNTKVSGVRAIAVAEHLAEVCSLKATARLVKVDPSVVRRLSRKAGEHGEVFHDERVQGLRVKALEGDERHGYVHDKGRPQWEAELIDPESKFIVSHVQGKRDETLIRRLLEDGASRLANRHELVLLTDGDASYATLFPQIFGQAYRPARHGNRGCLPHWCYRIPRSWLTFRSSNIVKVDGSWIPKSAIRIAPAGSLIRYSANWVTPSPIPPPSSVVTARLAA